MGYQETTYVTSKINLDFVTNKIENQRNSGLEGVQTH